MSGRATCLLILIIYANVLSDHLGFICQLMIDNRERNKKNCNGKARSGRIRSCDEEFFFVLIGNMEFKSALVFR